MKKLFLLAAMLFAATATFATNITVTTLTINNQNFRNLGAASTVSLNVTNGSTAVTCSACIPSRVVGLSGFLIAIGGVDYEVSYATSTSSLTLGTAYAGSTATGVSTTIYPMAVLQFYSDRTYWPSGSATPIVAGSEQNSGFFLRLGCTAINNTVRIPQFILPAISDAVNPADRFARITPVWYRLDGSRIESFNFCNSPNGTFTLQASPTTQTWEQICTYNSPRINQTPDYSTLTTAQINALFNNIAGGNISAGTSLRALISDASGKVSTSSVTSTELGRLAGVTANVQTQIDAKAPTVSPTFTGTPVAPTASITTNTTQLATTAFTQQMKGKHRVLTVATLPTSTYSDGTAVQDGDVVYVTDGNRAPRVWRSAISAWVDESGGVYEVRRFADDTGTVDSYAAIQSLLDSFGWVQNSQNETPVVVDFGRGTYRISQPLTVRQYRIKLRGNGAKIINTGTGAAFRVTSVSSGGVGSVNSALYTEISGFEITNTSTGSGILLQDAPYAEISQCAITGTGGYGIDVQGSVSAKIKNNTISGFDYGIITETYTKNYSGCSVCPYYGETFDAEISGNVVTFASIYGITTREGGGLKIQFNSIQSSGSRGIALESTFGSQIIGNYFELNGLTDITIENVTRNVVGRVADSNQVIANTVGGEPNPTLPVSLTIAANINKTIVESNYFGGTVSIGTGATGTRIGYQSLVGTITDFGTNTMCLPCLTSGSILFAGSNGAIAQKGSNFFWDNSNNRLIVGGTSGTDSITTTGAVKVGVNGSGVSLVVPGGGAARTGVPGTDFYWDVGNFHIRNGDSSSANASLIVSGPVRPSNAAQASLGSALLPWQDLYFAGSSGTPASNNFRITGTATGARTVTFPDISGTVAMNITGTGSLNYAQASANSCEVLALTVTGAVDGEVVSIGIPATLSSHNTTSTFFGWVSASNTVSVRRCVISADASDPSAATVTVKIIR